MEFNVPANGSSQRAAGRGGPSSGFDTSGVSGLATSNTSVVSSTGVSVGSTAVGCHSPTGSATYGDTNTTNLTSKAVSERVPHNHQPRAINNNNNNTMVSSQLQFDESSRQGERTGNYSPTKGVKGGRKHTAPLSFPLMGASANTAMIDLQLSCGEEGDWRVRQREEHGSRASSSGLHVERPAADGTADPSIVFDSISHVAGHSPHQPAEEAACSASIATQHMNNGERGYVCGSLSVLNNASVSSSNSLRSFSYRSHSRGHHQQQKAAATAASRGLRRDELLSERTAAVDRLLSEDQDQLSPPLEIIGRSIFRGVGGVGGRRRGEGGGGGGGESDYHLHEMDMPEACDFVFPPYNGGGGVDDYSYEEEVDGSRVCGDGVDGFHGPSEAFSTERAGGGVGRYGSLLGSSTSYSFCSPFAQQFHSDPICSPPIHPTSHVHGAGCSDGQTTTHHSTSEAEEGADKSMTQNLKTQRGIENIGGGIGRGGSVASVSAATAMTGKRVSLGASSIMRSSYEYHHHHDNDVNNTDEADTSASAGSGHPTTFLMSGARHQPPSSHSHGHKGGVKRGVGGGGGARGLRTSYSYSEGMGIEWAPLRPEFSSVLFTSTSSHAGGVQPNPRHFLTGDGQTAKAISELTATPPATACSASHSASEGIDSSPFSQRIAPLWSGHRSSKEDVSQNYSQSHPYTNNNNHSQRWNHRASPFASVAAQHSSHGGFRGVGGYGALLGGGSFHSPFLGSPNFNGADCRAPSLIKHTMDGGALRSTLSYSYHHHVPSSHEPSSLFRDQERSAKRTRTAANSYSCFRARQPRGMGDTSGYHVPHSRRDEGGEGDRSYSLHVASDLPYRGAAYQEEGNRSLEVEIMANEARYTPSIRGGGGGGGASTSNSMNANASCYSRGFSHARNNSTPLHFIGIGEEKNSGGDVVAMNVAQRDLRKNSFPFIAFNSGGGRKPLDVAALSTAMRGGGGSASTLSEGGLHYPHSGHLGSSDSPNAKQRKKKRKSSVAGVLAGERPVVLLTTGIRLLYTFVTPPNCSASTYTASTPSKSVLGMGESARKAKRTPAYSRSPPSAKKDQQEAFSSPSPPPSPSPPSLQDKACASGTTRGMSEKRATDGNVDQHGHTAHDASFTETQPQPFSAATVVEGGCTLSDEQVIKRDPSLSPSHKKTFSAVEEAKAEEDAEKADEIGRVNSPHELPQNECAEQRQLPVEGDDNSNAAVCHDAYGEDQQDANAEEEEGDVLEAEEGERYEEDEDEEEDEYDEVLTGDAGATLSQVYGSCFISSQRILTEPAEPLVPFTHSDGVTRCVDNVDGNLVIYVGMILLGWLEVVSELGTGSFGQVVLCKDLRTVDNVSSLYERELDYKYYYTSPIFCDVEKSQGTLVAVKVIGNNATCEAQSYIEAQIMQDLLSSSGGGEGEEEAEGHGREGEEENTNDVRRDYVCHILASGASYGHHCIAMERYSCNLYEYLVSNSMDGLPISIVRAMAHQALASLSLVHGRGYVHCDIKPENIMVKLEEQHSNTILMTAPEEEEGEGEEGGDGGSSMSPVKKKTGGERPPPVEIAIIDFSSSCEIANPTFYEYIQSRYYRAPEAIVAAPYSTPMDIWSLGCVLAEMLIGRPLLPGANNFHQLNRITEMFGPLPTSLLEQGVNTGAYYRCPLVVSSSSIVHQHSHQHGVPPSPSARSTPFIYEYPFPDQQHFLHHNSSGGVNDDVESEAVLGVGGEAEDEIIHDFNADDAGEEDQSCPPHPCLQTLPPNASSAVFAQHHHVHQDQEDDNDNDNTSMNTASNFSRLRHNLGTVTIIGAQNDTNTNNANCYQQLQNASRSVFGASDISSSTPFTNPGLPTAAGTPFMGRSESHPFGDPNDILRCGVTVVSNSKLVSSSSGHTEVGIPDAVEGSELHHQERGFDRCGGGARKHPSYSHSSSSQRRHSTAQISDITCHHDPSKRGSSMSVGCLAIGILLQEGGMVEQQHLTHEMMMELPNNGTEMSEGALGLEVAEEVALTNRLCSHIVTGKESSAGTHHGTSSSSRTLENKNQGEREEEEEETDGDGISGGKGFAVPQLRPPRFGSSSPATCPSSPGAFVMRAQTCEFFGRTPTATGSFAMEVRLEEGATLAATRSTTCSNDMDITEREEKDKHEGGDADALRLADGNRESADFISGRKGTHDTTVTTTRALDESDTATSGKKKTLKPLAVRYLQSTCDDVDISESEASGQCTVVGHLSTPVGEEGNTNISHKPSAFNSVPDLAADFVSFSTGSTPMAVDRRNANANVNPAVGSVHDPYATSVSAPNNSFLNKNRPPPTPHRAANHDLRYEAGSGGHKTERHVFGGDGGTPTTTTGSTASSPNKYRGGGGRGGSKEKRVFQESPYHQHHHHQRGNSFSAASMNYYYSASNNTVIRNNVLVDDDTNINNSHGNDGGTDHYGAYTHNNANTNTSNPYESSGNSLPSPSSNSTFLRGQNFSEYSNVRRPFGGGVGGEREAEEEEEPAAPYTMMSEDEFCNMHGCEPAPWLRYLKYDTLQEIIQHMRLSEEEQRLSRKALVRQRKALYQFLKAMLEVDPTKRMTAEDLLHHPFITQRYPARSSSSRARGKDKGKGAEGTAGSRVGGDSPCPEGSLLLSPPSSPIPPSGKEGVNAAIPLGREAEGDAQ